MPPLSLSALATAVSLSGFGLAILAIAVADWRLRRRRQIFIPPEHARPVTVIRPLCGLEPFSEATLRSSFQVDHPDVELIFCVASSGDPVVPLVSRLIEEHPGRRARLLVGDDRVSANPKLNNCVKGWEAARSDWVILADSNVLMAPDFVDRMLAAWRPDTGLVCSTPIGAWPDGFWALVECAFLNTLQARWQYAGEALGLGFAQGKSMLWYRPFLDSLGGIRALDAEIAEDAAATKLVRLAGLHVHLVDAPFEQPLGRRRLAEIWARQLRWARLRRVTFPVFFAPEILSSPLVLASCLAWGTGGTEGGILLTGGLLLAAYAAEAILARRAGWHVSMLTPVAFLARDLAIPVLWAAAFLTRNVVWRGNPMHIATGPARPIELDPARP